MRFVFESQEEWSKKEEKLQKAVNDEIRDITKNMPIRVTDGKKFIGETDLKTLHILEQLALKMISDPDVFGTLPWTFYKKVFKIWMKRIWENFKNFFSRKCN